MESETEDELVLLESVMLAYTPEWFIPNTNSIKKHIPTLKYLFMWLMLSSLSFHNRMNIFVSLIEQSLIVWELSLP